MEVGRTGTSTREDGAAPDSPGFFCEFAERRAYRFVGRYRKTVERTGWAPEAGRRRAVALDLRFPRFPVDSPIPPGPHDSRTCRSMDAGVSPEDARIETLAAAPPLPGDEPSAGVRVTEST